MSTEPAPGVDGWWSEHCASMLANYQRFIADASLSDVQVTELHAIFFDIQKEVKNASDEEYRLTHGARRYTGSTLEEAYRALSGRRLQRREIADDINAVKYATLQTELNERVAAMLTTDQARVWKHYEFDVDAFEMIGGGLIRGAE